MEQEQLTKKEKVIQELAEFIETRAISEMVVEGIEGDLEELPTIEQAKEVYLSILMNVAGGSGWPEIDSPGY